MPEGQSKANRRSIIDLPHDEARVYFLKSESYLRLELPTYFRFDELLNDVAREVERNFSPKNHRSKVRKCDNVNYTILNNLDGKYAWRPYEIIHPVLYASLVNQMTKKKSWRIIVRRFEQFAQDSQIRCLSLPVQSLSTMTDSAEQVRQWWEEVEQESVELSLDFEYVFHTDIEDCYASIYTHSIAWALHTRKKAKKHKGRMSFIGNVIDTHIQDMRSGQTNGIPQGSVLTDFIAEMVLGYADLRLSKRISKLGIGQYQILRFRDDYRVFVNSPRDGERILKCLSEIMVELGMKLKREKTVASSDVIRSSYKEDKLDWLFRKKGDRSLQRELLIIHDQNMKHPDGRGISRALEEFDRRLECAEKIDFPVPLISIVTDIALRSPWTYHLSAAILSKLIGFLESDREKKAIFKKIVNRFSALPNTGHMDIWLQRLGNDVAPDIQFEEKLCWLVRQKSVPIWNNDWIESPTLRNIVDPRKIIDLKDLEQVPTVIPNREIRFFGSLYLG